MSFREAVHVLFTIHFLIGPFTLEDLICERSRAGKRYLHISTFDARALDGRLTGSEALRNVI